MESGRKGAVMKQTLRRGLPVAVVSVLIVAAVLLATRPWSGEEASGGAIQYRVCDTVLEAPLVPDARGRRDLLVVSRVIAAVHGISPRLEVEVKLPSQGSQRSSVSIDPANATILWERYGAADHQARINAVLNTLRIEALDPATAPWPYTDGTQMSLERRRSGAFEYRPTDPGSGIVVGLTTGLGDGFHRHVLNVENCRSTMQISAVFRTVEPEEVTVTKDIHPDDEAAFQAFYDEVVVRGLDY